MRLHRYVPAQRHSFKRIQVATLVRLGLVLGVLHSVALSAGAMVVLTNCEDPGPSQSMPKRTMSGCADLGLPDYYWISDAVDPATNGFTFGFYRIDLPYTEVYSGFGRTDGDGRFIWKYAVRDATVYLPASVESANHFAVIQNLDVGTGLAACFGLYEDTNGTLTPLFERQLPIDDQTRVRMTELSNGTVVVCLAQIDSIVLLGFEPSGQLAWARQLRSTEFPAVTMPNLPPPEIFISATPSDQALIYVGATQSVEGVNTAISALLCVDSAGDLQWAKKIQLPYAQQGPHPSVWRTTPAGDSTIVFGDVEIDASFNVTALATVMRLSPQGDLVYVTQLEDVTWSASDVFVLNDADALVLGFVHAPGPSFENHNVYAIMDATGNLTSTVQVDLPNSALAPLAGVSETSGRIYYHGSYSATGSQGPYTGLIGSSSLTLDDFKWQQYDKSTVEVSGATLFHLADDRLVFVARDENAQWTDFALLNSDLTVEGDCELFSPVSFPISSLSLATRSVTPTITDMSVQSDGLSPTVEPADLVFEQMVFTEDSLCTTPNSTLGSTLNQ